MKLRLTQREIMVLGWDETDCPILRQLANKCRDGSELTPEEWQTVQQEAKYLPSRGESDASIVRTATIIKRKIEDVTDC